MTNVDIFFRTSKGAAKANGEVRKLPSAVALSHAGEKTADLGPGDSTSFPTWSFWGTTNVIMTNTGPVELTVTLQAGTGGVQSWSLAPQGQDGSVVHTSGQWAASPVWLTNASEDPAAMIHLEVW